MLMNLEIKIVNAQTSTTDGNERIKWPELM